MSKLITLTFLLILLLTGSAGASIFFMLDDPMDDQQMVTRAATRPAANESRETMACLAKKLSSWKERDFVAICGPALKLPEKMAMPVVQPRGLGLSGLRYPDEKMNHDHVDVYAVGTIGYVQVYYGIDGQSVMAILFYLRPDAEFVLVGPDDQASAKRFTWDQHKLAEMADWITDRWREVYQFEVDPLKESQQLAGDFSRDIRTKLAAWKETGRKQGWKLEAEPATNGCSRQWSWYDDKGNLLREASPYPGNELPNVFIWVYPGTRNEKHREEGMGQGYLSWSRWCRPGGTNIRYEILEHGNESAPWRADTWVWYDGQGKEIRVEQDTNGDGLPDRLSANLDAKQDDSLPLAKSWAVHPELIPRESRIEDEQRAIPVREIPLRQTRALPR